MPTDTFADSEDDEPCHRFQNPSGLSLYKNITKPEQIMLLAAVAYRNRTFREIVSTKEYGIVVRNERYGLERRLTWRNTNKLLWKGWEGIKTGTTENAGPCLIGKIDNYLIGVFNCGGHQKRFNEAILIHEILRKTI
jgi:D-alanyl-D-alanine carboxypeptidase (penicillin-binding protein 5/6)